MSKVFSKNCSRLILGIVVDGKIYKSSAERNSVLCGDFTVISCENRQIFLHAFIKLKVAVKRLDHGYPASVLESVFFETSVRKVGENRFDELLCVGIAGEVSSYVEFI